jgi:hypothetical protein
LGGPSHDLERKLSWETSWAEADLARRFVQRVTGLSPGDRRPALSPMLNRDPYLSAWMNVEAALSGASSDDHARLAALIAELDAALDDTDMLPSLREAGRRAVRALLAQRWLLTPESLTFLYEPFESAIPLASLAE